MRLGRTGRGRLKKGRESEAKEEQSAPKVLGVREVATITCLHCRYERPAKSKHCPFCGYPWPWMKP